MAPLFNPSARKWASGASCKVASPQALVKGGLFRVCSPRLGKLPQERALIVEHPSPAYHYISLYTLTCPDMPMYISLEENPYVGVYMGILLLGGPEVRSNQLSNLPP